MNLNEEQKLVVNHLNGPCLVISCPGSGKTQCITSRVAKMISSGIDPKSIINITFTNKAAREMRDRIDRMTDGETCGFIGTFHGFCVAIIKKFGHHVGYDTFNIIDTNDQVDAIGQSARLIDVVIDKTKSKKVMYAVNAIRENYTSNDLYELETELYDDLKDNTLVRVAYKYLDYIKANRLIDFSGLLYEAYTLISNDKYGALQLIHNKFKYFQVDEVQDTNFIQFEIIKKLSSENNNILMIGDDAQSIYAFRGARVDNIYDYLKQNPECTVINLSKNYRSTPQIIDVAKKIIDHNDDKLEFKFEPTNESGEDVRVREFVDPDREAYQVSHLIKCLIEDYGYKPRDIAVLYRINAMSQPIEVALAKSGQPYKVVGSRSFYDRKEIKDCVSMLKIKSNPRDTIAFLRLHKMIPGFGEKAFSKLESYVLENDVDIFTALKKLIEDKKPNKLTMSVSSFINAYDFDHTGMKINDIYSHIMEKLNYEEYLEKQCSDGGEFEDRNSNVKQLVISSSDYTPSLDKYLNTILLQSSSDEESEDNKVTLMSLHACKGLEFPVVFIIGVEEGNIPHYLSSDTKKKVNEERRLMYVGVTRAKEMLFMSYCKLRKKTGNNFRNIQHKTVKKSRFLEEAGH